MRFTPAAQHTDQVSVRSLRADSVVIPKTYWLEGGAIGGTALGLLLSIGLMEWCQQESGSCGSAFALGLVVGGATGFGVGAMIGGQFPKSEPPPN